MRSRACRADTRALIRRGQPKPRGQALGHRGVTSGAAEDEGDRRQQTLAVEDLDDVGARRHPDSAGPRVASGRRAPRGPAPRPPLPFAPAVRPLSERALSARDCSARIRTSSRLTSAAPTGPVPVSPGSANRSYSRRPTSTDCHRGTGRCSSTMTAVSPRTVSSHSPNSSALLTVADSDTRRTGSGSARMTSSHTPPRKRSAR